MNRKEYIRKYYGTVSDRDIAEEYGCSVRAVAVMCRRMGLKKDKEQVSDLQSMARYSSKNVREPDFTNFWNG